MTTEELNMDYSKYDFKDSTDLYVYTSKKGLSRGTVEEISRIKNEPQWMLDFRLRSYDIFMKKPMPVWGGDLSKINFQNIFYYTKASEKQSKSWDDVPDSVRKTFDKLGIPEAEKKFLAGVGAQYESETVYHNLREDLSKQGVIFSDTDTAVKEHPDILKKYFGKVIPPEDNKFAALNSAVWSGGSFIYVPPNVKIELPLQAYFRINAENIGQFERTLIIADEGSEVHYIEGCTAPVYTTESLHSAVVELIAKKDAKIRYTTIQNWSKDVYNLVTKRAYAYENARVEWIDGNIGSKLTMKYPGVYMLGRNAHAEVVSIAFAGSDQHQDAGAKAVHLAPDTTSRITSKSVSKQSGRTTYRGLLHVAKGATGVKSNVRCDALLLDETSRTDTYPYVEVNEDDATISHEASVGKIGEDQIFYLMSRGFSESDALSLIVGGFIEPFTKELPMEYAVELNRLVKLEMEDSVG
ncbi:MAG: Fe-S cluster assembly protein SufB [Nitrososphaeraceae archaeon]|jgi:Fe-S cluster assembly protein SufB|nr:Fe-S cluster assembly protein SufB [Nitrososphaeraceae archaeon]MDW3626428.1 Fe-S cluster assembly protein SufB [Nitrososphaeraceae archaeon]MDW3630288.1 Fe-S cluster assembly protein SufB [Nitrososphaeraceae archaeon]